MFAFSLFFWVERKEDKSSIDYRIIVGDVWTSRYVFSHTAALSARAGALLRNTTPRLSLRFGACNYDSFLVTILPSLSLALWEP